MLDRAPCSAFFPCIVKARLGSTRAAHYGGLASDLVESHHIKTATEARRQMQSLIGQFARRTTRWLPSSRSRSVGFDEPGVGRHNTCQAMGRASPVYAEGRRMPVYQTVPSVRIHQQTTRMCAARQVPFREGLCLRIEARNPASVHYGDVDAAIACRSGVARELSCGHLRLHQPARDVSISPSNRRNFT
jgi:hypothetical protein